MRIALSLPLVLAVACTVNTPPPAGPAPALGPAPAGEPAGTTDGEIGVPVADVFARLQAAGDRRQYLAEDGVHWRPAAMEVAARAWADALRRVEWVLRDR